MFSKKYFTAILSIISIIYSILCFAPQKVLANNEIKSNQPTVTGKVHSPVNSSRRTAINHKQTIRRIDNLADKQLDRTKDMQRQQDERRMGNK